MRDERLLHAKNMRAVDAAIRHMELGIKSRERS